MIPITAWLLLPTLVVLAVAAAVVVGGYDATPALGGMR